MFDEKYDTKKDSMLEPRENWIHLGKGRHRIAWLLPSGYVLKVPTSESGEDANEREAETWKNRNKPDLLFERIKKWKFARCRLVQGTKLLLMEFIKPCADTALSQRKLASNDYYPVWSRNIADVRYRDLPDWCLKVDCAQVGFNRKGELVAYDFAE